MTSTSAQAPSMRTDSVEHALLASRMLHDESRQRGWVLWRRVLRSDADSTPSGVRWPLAGAAPAEGVCGGLKCFSAGSAAPAGGVVSPGCACAAMSEWRCSCIPDTGGDGFIVLTGDVMCSLSGISGHNVVHRERHTSMGGRNTSLYSWRVSPSFTSPAPTGGIHACLLSDDKPNLSYMHPKHIWPSAGMAAALLNRSSQQHSAPVPPMSACTKSAGSCSGNTAAMASLMRRKGTATPNTRAAEYTQHDTRFSWCWLNATCMQGQPVRMRVMQGQASAVTTAGMQLPH